VLWVIACVSAGLFVYVAGFAVGYFLRYWLAANAPPLLAVDQEWELRPDPDRTSDPPRPLTTTELTRWLGNIAKMHDFGQACDYGSPTHRLYHDGMAEAARYILACVKLTPIVTGAEVVDRLKAVMDADPKALRDLFELRVFADDAVIADDCPAVPYPTADGSLQLGTLGVINGLLPRPWRVVASYDDKTGDLIDLTLRRWDTDGDAELQSVDGPELREAGPQA